MRFSSGRPHLLIFITMIKRKITVLLCAVFIAMLFAKCKKKDESAEITPESSFDKTGMLSNIGENIIIPNYNELKTKIDSLKILNDLFIANPSLTSLNALQTQFIKSYFTYQSCSTFEIGPAEDEIIRVNFNTFPCDTLEIKTKIETGNVSLSTVADIDSKGFPAIDFLIYGSSQNNNAVLINYTTGVNAANAKNYLALLINELKLKTDAVNTAWAVNGGNYGSTFKGNTGSDVGGSIGMLVNQLNYDFELLKNAKIGIPLGKKTFGTPIPEKVEAYYSTQSLVLVTEHLKSIENIYLGRNSQNADGLGLDDYLEHAKAQHSLGLLNDVIKSQFTLAKTKLAAIPGTLSQAVVSNAAIVDAAYAELQKLVVLLKVDVPSALGILITYQDNDGD